MVVEAFDFVKFIETLNISISKYVSDDEFVPFTYVTCGFSEQILFCNNVMYDSELDVFDDDIEKGIPFNEILKDHLVIKLHNFLNNVSDSVIVIQKF